MSQFHETYTPAAAKRGMLGVVVYGINPIPGQLDPVVQELQRHGDVFSYMYDTSVVTGGDPSALPELIGKLTNRVAEVAETGGYGPDRIRIAGASLGALIGLNIVDELAIETPAVFGAAGVTGWKNIMRNPIFCGAARAMRHNGHTAAGVRAAWGGIDIFPERIVRPSTKFLTTASVLDPVTPYQAGRTNMKRWQEEQGVRLKYVRSRRLFHTATIKEYAGGFSELAEMADRL